MDMDKDERCWSRHHQKHAGISSRSQQQPSSSPAVRWAGRQAGGQAGRQAGRKQAGRRARRPARRPLHAVTWVECVTGRCCCRHLSGFRPPLRPFGVSVLLSCPVLLQHLLLYSSLPSVRCSGCCCLGSHAKCGDHLQHISYHHHHHHPSSTSSSTIALVIATPLPNASLPRAKTTITIITKYGREWGARTSSQIICVPVVQKIDITVWSRNNMHALCT